MREHLDTGGAVGEVVVKAGQSLEKLSGFRRWTSPAKKLQRIRKGVITSAGYCCSSERAKMARRPVDVAVDVCGDAAGPGRPAAPSVRPGSRPPRKPNYNGSA